MTWNSSSAAEARQGDHDGLGSSCQLAFSSVNLDTGIFNVTQLLTTDGSLECSISFTNTLPDGYTRLWLQFERGLPAANRKSCNNSFISVYGFDSLDARQSFLLRRYCDSASDQIQTSYSRVVMLIRRQRITDRISLTGKCTFTSSVPAKQLPNMEHSSGCGQRTLTALGGSVSAPNGRMASRVKCSWTIVVPPRHQVMLVISEMSLGSHDLPLKTPCIDTGEHLSIYNGLMDLSRSPDVRLCGQLDALDDDVRTLLSNNNWMNLRYVSRLGRNSSFKASWTAVYIPGTGRQMSTVALAVAVPAAILLLAGLALAARCICRRMAQRRYAVAAHTESRGCKDCNDAAAARRHYRQRMSRHSRKPWSRLGASSRSESAMPLGGRALSLDIGHTNCSRSGIWTSTVGTSERIEENPAKGPYNARSTWSEDTDME